MLRFDTISIRKIIFVFKFINFLLLKVTQQVKIAKFFSRNFTSNSNYRCVELETIRLFAENSRYIYNF